MGPGEFESALNAVEHLLGSIGQDIRYAFDIWRKEPVNPDALRNQAHAIEGHQSPCTQLINDYTSSLTRLQQTWGGEQADLYLGQGKSGGESHQFLSFLSSISDLLDYNGAAHEKLVTKTVQIRDAHGQLDGCVNTMGFTLVGMAATVLIPGVDLVTESVGSAALVGEAAEGVELADTVVSITETVESVETVSQTVNVANTAKNVWTVGRTVQAVVAVTTLIAVLGAVLVPLMPTNSLPSNNANGSDEKTKIDQLHKDYPDDQEYINELLAKGFSADEIRALLEKIKKGGEAYRYTPQQIDALLKAGLTAQEITVLATHLTATQGNYVLQFINKTDSPYTPDQRLAQMRQFITDLTFTSKNSDPKIAAQENAGMQLALNLFIQFGLPNLRSYEAFRSITTPRGQQRSKPDFVTEDPAAAVEVTVQSTGKINQVDRDALTSPVDPETGEKEPVILVAPDYTDGATEQLLKEMKKKYPDQDIWVVRDGHVPVDSRTTSNPKDQPTNGKTVQQNLEDLLNSMP